MVPETMDRLLLLLLASVSVGVVAGRTSCPYPQWQTLVGKNSVGGTQLTNVTSRAECQNFCAQNSSDCIAVDIDTNNFPPGCWLHFNADDLLPEKVYDQPTTNQYRLTGCSNVPTTAACGDSTWEMYPNQNSVGAFQYLGPRTIQQCLDYCSNNTQCLAVDIDVREVPIGCWPHLHSDDLKAINVYPQQGTNQYRLVQRCPVRSTSVCYNPEWSVLLGQSADHGVQYIGPTSVQECLDSCGQSNKGCVAVDVDTTQNPPTCWQHFSLSDLGDDNMYPQAGVNQYRLVDRCASSPITASQATTTATVTTTLGPVCPVGRWQLFRNQNAAGAEQHEGPRTIQQCLDFCNRNPACVAVDIDVNQVPLRCWPHFNVDDLKEENIFPQPGTTQYRLVDRCTRIPPASGCYNPDWSVLYNTSAYGAVEHVGPKSVQECLDYCGQSAAGCVAVDVNVTNNALTCWPHFSSDALKTANIFPQSGINQYRLITKCADYPVGASPPTTTTPEPTTTQGAICPNGRWNIIPDQTAFGASEYTGPRTIEQCLAYCNNRSDCVAVDVDMNEVPLKCWPHFAASELDPENIFDQPGTYLYQLVERCSNKTVVSECYNPDWSVLVGQSSTGAVKYDGATTIQQCLDYCGKVATGCIAVDFDRSTTPYTCWLHFQSTDLNNLYQREDVNQYRLLTKCADYPVGVSPSTTTLLTTTTLGPICPHGRWQQFPIQVADGATQYMGPRTVAQCLDYCNNRTDCVAVDIDVNSVPVGCWPHFSASDLDPNNIYNQLGTVQYRLVERCTQPRTDSECYNPEWAVLVNQSSFGTTQYVGPTSVQECLDYCGQTAVGCVAVDVDLTKNPPACWPHFSISSLVPNNTFEQIGVNQYLLVTKCAKPPTISPAFGPQAGGTSVNITYTSINMLEIVYVVFGGMPSPVQSSTRTSVVVFSPPSNALAFSSIQLVTAEGRTTSIEPQFEYRANPVVTDIKPRSHLINGGTLVTIFGANLDSVARPIIQITVETFSSSQDVFRTAMIERCHKPTDKSLVGRQLVCQMPSVAIPPDVQSKLEISDGLFSGSRDGGRGGVAGTVTEDGRTVVIYAGVDLDGLTTYNNITSTMPNVLMDFYVQPAVYCSQGADDSVVFSPKSDLVVSVSGYGLLRGSRASDFVVSVGDETCEVIDVSNTGLLFRPPMSAPQRTTSDAGCQNGGITLAITAGYAAYRCCIVYSDTTTTSLNIPLILGLTLGLALPLLIIIVVVVICCCCFRSTLCCRRDKCKLEKSPVGPIENPNYEHSTLSAAPSTSSSTAPIGQNHSPPVQTDPFNFYWAPEKPGGSTRVRSTYSEEKETGTS